MTDAFGAVFDVPVEVTVVLGRRDIRISQLLKLGRGAVVELDRNLHDPVELYVNNKLVARGEVVCENDKLSISITEVLNNR
jgi:flagellar motor switch protein FliN/FliY